MRKGSLVRLRPNPDQSWSGMPSVLRHVTADEVNKWRESPESKGMNCAGETKLPPRIATVQYKDEDTWTIVQARCAPILGYLKRPKCARIMNNRTNEMGYVRRFNIVPV